MAYSEKLANKIRIALSHLSNVKEKKMFGGLAFMINDKMCITVGAEKIMCRIEPDFHEDAIRKKGCSTVVMGKREYKGYVRIDEDALKTQKIFDYWIGLALDYNKIARASKK